MTKCARHTLGCSFNFIILLYLLLLSETKALYYHSLTTENVTKALRMAAETLPSLVGTLQRNLPKRQGEDFGQGEKEDPRQGAEALFNLRVMQFDNP